MSDMGVRERFWTWWFDGFPQPVADRMFERVANEELRKLADRLVADNRELTRQRDDARELVVRSGYFTDCEETGAGQDCVMWHRGGQHIGIAASSDHSVGVDGEACACDWCCS